jgi:peroxiredoxin
MQVTLQLAALYNILWGAWVVLFPDAFFAWAGLDLPNYRQIWQSVGMIVGVYGIGYFLASFDPYKHYPIVLVGFLGKLFGPVGAVWYAVQGEFPWIFGLNNITNDLIWLVPFALILYGAFRENQDVSKDTPVLSVQEAMQHTHDQHGVSLYERSLQHPVLVTFLRHQGCTFCRETLAKVAALQQEITAQGVKTAFVSMSPNENALAFVEKYGLKDSYVFSDPRCQVYEAFDLKRASFGQVFGLRSFVRGFQAGIVQGHGIGLLEGDGFRMPGTFLVYKGKIIKAFRHQKASDQPDYLGIAACALPEKVGGAAQSGSQV